MFARRERNYLNSQVSTACSVSSGQLCLVIRRAPTMRLPRLQQNHPALPNARNGLQVDLLGFADLGKGHQTTYMLAEGRMPSSTFGDQLISCLDHYLHSDSVAPDRIPFQGYKSQFYTLQVKRETVPHEYTEQTCFNDKMSNDCLLLDDSLQHVHMQRDFATSDDGTQQRSHYLTQEYNSKVLQRTYDSLYIVGHRSAGMQNNMNLLRYLCLQSISKNQNIYLHFLVRGHSTTFADGVFGITQEQLKTQSIHTPSQLHTMLNNTLSCNFVVDAHRVPQRVYSQQATQIFTRKRLSIPDVHHYFFDRKRPGILLVRDSVDDAWVEYEMLREGVYSANKHLAYVDPPFAVMQPLEKHRRKQLEAVWKTCCGMSALDEVVEPQPSASASAVAERNVIPKPLDDGNTGDMIDYLGLN